MALHCEHDWTDSGMTRCPLCDGQTDVPSADAPTARLVTLAERTDDGDLSVIVTRSDDPAGPPVGILLPEGDGWSVATMGESATRYHGAVHPDRESALEAHGWSHGPSETVWADTLWVCVDCLMVAESDGAPDRDPSLPAPWSAVPDGLTTVGLIVTEHECDWAGGSREDECGCEYRTFSRSACDACASTLAGERHAFTLWAAPDAPTGEDAPSCATIGCQSPATVTIAYPLDAGPSDGSADGQAIDRVCSPCADGYLSRPVLRARIVTDAPTGDYVSVPRVLGMGAVLPVENDGPADGGELEHVNYPHEPGRLYDCPACAARCVCVPCEHGAYPYAPCVADQCVQGDGE